MRCRICDVVIAEPQYNSDHDDYEPCSYCQEIIKDAVGNDKASADEDELGDDHLEDQFLLPLLEGEE